MAISNPTGIEKQSHHIPRKQKARNIWQIEQIITKLSHMTMRRKLSSQRKGQGKGEKKQRNDKSLESLAYPKI